MLRCSVKSRIRLLTDRPWDCPVAHPTSGERFRFQIGPAGKNRFPSAEVYVVGCHVANGLVIPLAVVVVDEAGDMVVADGDGVIVVPAEVARDVASHARTMLDEDKPGRRRKYEEMGIPLDETVT